MPRRQYQPIPKRIIDKMLTTDVQAPAVTVGFLIPAKKASVTVRSCQTVAVARKISHAYRGRKWVLIKAQVFLDGPGFRALEQRGQAVGFLLARHLGTPFIPDTLPFIMVLSNGIGLMLIGLLHHGTPGELAAAQADKARDEGTHGDWLQFLKWKADEKDLLRISLVGAGGRTWYDRDGYRGVSGILPNSRNLV